EWSTIPSIKSPSEMSCTSAIALRTLRTRFSMRMPVWTRSMVAMRAMVPWYQCNSKNLFSRGGAGARREAKHAGDGEAAEEDEEGGAPIKLVPAAEIERGGNAAEEESGDHDCEQLGDPSGGPPHSDVADREKNGRRAEHPESDSHRRQTLARLSHEPGSSRGVTYDDRSRQTVERREQDPRHRRRSGSPGALQVLPAEARLRSALSHRRHGRDVAAAAQSRHAPDPARPQSPRRHE